MLTLIIFASLLAFFFLLSNLVWLFFYKRKLKEINSLQKEGTQLRFDEFDSRIKSTLSTEITDLKTKNTQFHEDIIKLRKENVELRNSNNDLLSENYRLKDKNKILDETNFKIEQDFSKVIPINKELFAENETLRIELNSKESMITHLKSTAYLRAVLDGTEKPEEINKIHPPIFKTNPSPSVIVKETNGEENKNIPTVN